MSDIEHPDSLDDFINGRLSDQENEAIIAHLASCTECEARVEQLWMEAPLGGLIPMVPTLAMQDAVESERSLFRKIHRSDLGGQVVRLFTKGFVGLLTGLLSPIVTTLRPPKSSGG